MGNLGHQAARLAASKICDNIVKGLCKDPETEVVKLIDMWQKFMGDEKIDLNYDSARKMICDKDCTLNKYMHRLINEIDPHVLKTIALNLGFEAFVYGTKTIRKNRESMAAMCMAHSYGSDKCLQSALYRLLGSRVWPQAEPYL